VLLLTAWEGLTTDQAATVLGCSPQAFRVRAHRARRRLMDVMRMLEQPHEVQSVTEVCK
jgi:RNA polymerase sigma-70 factor (ECF subfamily)